MGAVVKHIVAFLLRLGAGGLLLIGVLDSSFLFLPLGNDLLMVTMAARAHVLWKALFYAAVATAGSVIGCALLDFVGRKGGGTELEKHVPKKRLDFLKRKMNKRAGWALLVGAIMPPPFPFTPFVAAAAALQYPRKKLLGVIAGARLVRFSTEAVLGMHFGRSIISFADEPAVHWFILALVVLSVGGSAFSVYQWIRRSRTRAR